jgi:hypothetical protein
MKTNFSMRNTKYGLPVILFPFFILGAWVISKTFPADEKSAAQTQILEGMNTNLPDPALGEQKDRFRLLQELVDRQRRETGILDLKELDRAQQDDDEFDIESFLTPVTDEIVLAPDDLNAMTTEEALNALHRQYFPNDPDLFPATSRAQPKNVQEEELRMMREQMARIESLLANKTPETKDAIEPVEDDILIATKADGFKSSAFNTISGNRKNMFISAILDEAQTVVAGSRIRIRLMDDIFIGDHLFKQGTYLFGLVTGFRSQRVLVNITTALYDDKILKLNLTIFDNDGIQGLYVPSSDFREMMQAAGSRMTQSSNVTINSSQEAYQQFISQMGQDFYRSVTRAVSQRIRQNKAKLKYASIIYLINEDDKN